MSDPRAGEAITTDTAVPGTCQQVGDCIKRQERIEELERREALLTAFVGAMDDVIVIRGEHARMEIEPSEAQYERLDAACRLAEQARTDLEGIGLPLPELEVAA